MSGIRSTSLPRLICSAAAVALLFSSSTGSSYLKWRLSDPEALKELSRVLDAATAKGNS